MTESGGRRRALVGALRRVCTGGGAHPRTVVVCLTTRRETLAIAGTVPLHHAPELVPVDRAEVPVLRFVVVLQVGIRNLETNRFRLRDGEIHESLAELVVALLLHSPLQQ